MDEITKPNGAACRHGDPNRFRGAGGSTASVFNFFDLKGGRDAPSGR
jgi:hypothetical protein